jgi:hypothetical protein
MGAKPFNQENLIVVVDRHDQPVIVSFNVKNNTLCRNDARGAILAL